MRWAPLLAALAASVAAGGVVGCGDDGAGTAEGGSSASADERRIRATLTKALTSHDPGICRRLMTDAYLLQSRQETTARSALKRCRRDLKTHQATAVEVGDVEHQGRAGSAVVRTKDGGLPFKRASIALRRVRGKWRLHRLTDGALDRARFVAVTRDELMATPDPMSAPDASCVLRSLEPLSDETIVDAYVGGDSAFILKPAVLCGARNALSGPQLSGRAQACARGRLRRALDGPDAIELLNAFVAGSDASAERRMAAIIDSCI